MGLAGLTQWLCPKPTREDRGGIRGGLSHGLCPKPNRDNTGESPVGLLSHL